VVCATIIETFVGVEEMHMASLKRGTIVASILMLVVIVTSACDLPYSTPPASTNTPIDPNSLFETPIAETPSMSDLEVFGTGTALALTGTPLPDIATQTPSTPLGTQDLTASAASVTPTPLVSTNPTSTATLAISGTTVGTLPTSAPVGSRPSSYTLQPGEFPYCIARRFDVNPDDLLTMNNLASGDIYYPNLTLRIPQTGSFPGTRALQNHPTTYSAVAGETVYGVACKFGDVDPAAIAQANNISPSAVLTAGQPLNIP
jgi:LysM repeat protein